MDKLHISYPILVEGKYDKQKIASVTDAVILTTNGFSVFNSREKEALLRTLSQKSPIIVLTDSDKAGQMIRSRLHQYIPKGRIIEVYIPPIEGKEKRKEKPSAEGLLGVEGMDESLLYNLLKPFSVSENGVKKAPITKSDLYEAGLTGKKDSAHRRDEVAARLGLPRGMTPNAFLEAICLLCTYEDFQNLLK